MSLSEFFQGANQYLANNPVVHGGTVLVSSYAMLRLGRLLERRKHKKAEHDAIMKQVFKDPKASVEVMRYERDEETGSYKQHVEVLAFDIELANLFPADMSEKLVRAIQDAIETCTAENSVIFLHLEEMLQDDPEWPHLKDELLRDWHRFF